MTHPLHATGPSTRRRISSYTRGGGPWGRKGDSMGRAGEAYRPLSGSGSKNDEQDQARLLSKNTYYIGYMQIDDCKNAATKDPIGYPA
jgi:hypothetical protein